MKMNNKCKLDHDTLALELIHKGILRDTNCPDCDFPLLRIRYMANAPIQYEIKINMETSG
jgi:hypothetical protein